GPDGKELAKRRGYILADAMLSMLQAFADDPTPGPSVVPEEKVRWAAGGALTPALRRDLERRHREAYDPEHGGWGLGHKYVEAESAEYALRRAAHGDRAAE